MITLTLDGLWKVTRAKSCFEGEYMETDFGDVKSVCIRTPKPFSYFCQNHQNRVQNFDVNGKKLEFKPEMIVATVIFDCNYSYLI